MEAVDQIPREEFAGVPRRLLAFVFDVLVFVPVLLVVMVLASLPVGGELELSGGLASLFVFGVLAAWELGWTALGGKPGQRFAGFHVLGLDGQRLTGGRVIARVAVKYGCWLLPILYAVSLVLVSKSPRAQSIHDLAAGSVCIERAGRERLSSPQAASNIEAPPLQAPVQTSTTSTEDDRHQGPFL